MGQQQMGVRVRFGTPSPAPSVRTEGIHEGEVVSVLVSVGDKVNEGDPIVEVETDKATVEVPCSVAGKVTKVHVSDGETVKVGQVVEGRVTALNTGGLELTVDGIRAFMPISQIEMLATKTSATLIRDSATISGIMIFSSAVKSASR